MKNIYNKKRKQGLRNGYSSRGFTLIEMIVASGIFVTAMVVIVGAVVSLESANRKVRATRIVMDNVGAAIDSMSRSLRTGSNFHCGPATIPSPLTERNACVMNGAGGGGDDTVAFEAQFGDPLTADDQYVYRLGTHPNGNGSIERSTNAGSASPSYVALTAPEINITALRFWVGGVDEAADQPYVTMVVRGTAGTSGRTITDFNIQTTVSQRTPNFF